MGMELGELSDKPIPTKPSWWTRIRNQQARRDYREYKLWQLVEDLGYKVLVWDVENHEEREQANGRKRTIRLTKIVLQEGGSAQAD
jgi:hypothetical protein